MRPTNFRDWLAELEKQRRSLRIPFRVLAEMAGLSPATVRRVLQTQKPSSSLESVLAIAEVLGASVELKIEDPEMVVERQIQATSKAIATMVQGTMALESQGTTDPRQIEALVETAAREIRSGPRERIWIRPCRSPKSSPAKHPSPTSPS